MLKKTCFSFRPRQALSVHAQARDRFVARQLAAATPAERLARFAALQAETFERLRQSPEGWKNFMRRNLHKRAIRVPAHD
jgi:hypothetical protein